MDPDGSVEVVQVADVGEDALLVHDEHKENPGLAFQLSRLSRGPYEPTPIGVFRDVDHEEYGAQMADQIETATARRGPGDFAALLRSGRTIGCSGASGRGHPLPVVAWRQRRRPPPGAHGRPAVAPWRTRL
jgi:hypothetical protein